MDEKSVMLHGKRRRLSPHPQPFFPNLPLPPLPHIHKHKFCINSEFWKGFASEWQNLSKRRDFISFDYNLHNIIGVIISIKTFSMPVNYFLVSKCRIFRLLNLLSYSVHSVKLLKQDSLIRQSHIIVCRIWSLGYNFKLTKGRNYFICDLHLHHIISLIIFIGTL